MAQILIVDDEMPIRRLLSVAIQRSGFGTIEAESAAAALAVLKASPPQLVLLDLGLPDRDGLELIGAFREKAVPIIVLTAREASKGRRPRPWRGRLRHQTLRQRGTDGAHPVLPATR
jgi:two-component system KDP operon response regulator KdpE